MNTNKFENLIQSGGIFTGHDVYFYDFKSRYIGTKHNLKKGILLHKINYHNEVRVLHDGRVLEIPIDDVYISEQEAFISGLNDKGKKVLNAELEGIMNYFFENGSEEEDKLIYHGRK